MNKYSHLSKERQRQRSREKMCENKAQFVTKEDAFQKGQRIYKCPHCNAWHRSGQREEFIQNIIKRNS